MVYLSNFIGMMIIEAYANISHVFVRARGVLYLENGSPSSPPGHPTPARCGWWVGRVGGDELHSIATTHSYF